MHSQLTAPAPAPAPGSTGTRHPAPAPGTSTSNLSPPRAQPAQSTSTGTNTSNLSPPRAQPAHSTSTSAAPGTQHHHQPATCLHRVHSQLTAPAPATCLHHMQTSSQHQHWHPAPGTGTSTSNLSPPRAQPAHSTSASTGTSNLSRKRARATHYYLKSEPHSFAIWGKTKAWCFVSESQQNHAVVAHNLLPSVWASEKKSFHASGCPIFSCASWLQP